MKRRIALLFGAIVFLFLVVGCAESPRRFDARFCDAECEAQRQADLEYLTVNFPTREEMHSVRECVTDETGYEYDELPADYGPELLTKRNPEPTKIESEMPFRLVERALVAVGQRKPLRERVNGAREDCIYELGLEGKFFAPSSPENYRPRNS